MTLHIHTLAGCSPTPLAHYLKALGVLRLVAEQKDQHVRGWWRNETFHLATSLTSEELERFFLDEYRPTPLVTPWNGGSGFYPKDNKSGIEPIERSSAARFEPYRAAIQAGRMLTSGWSESPKDDAKFALLCECRRTWRGSQLDWLEAALVLDQEGNPAYPALLGTGGNDGRLDFTNNFMQRLTELFDCAAPAAPAFPNSRTLLTASLFASATPGLKGNAIGQFFPGAAGGANSTVGYGGGALVNSWDFVLMLEGAIVLASALTRRVTTESLPQASAPFAVYASAAGYASAADGEKNRGEQWMPLWDQAVTYRELVNFVSEGRCQLQESSGGRRSKSAQRPLDVARAIGRLGVARGVTAFQRFGYIERNGQANLATPLGRWNVPAQPVPNLELIDEIKPWFDQLQRAAGDKNAPAGVGRAARTCENAMLACCRDQTDAARWQRLFIALGDAEAQLVQSPGFTGRNVAKGLQPLGAFINGLSPRWLNAINDRSAELRLALAFAGQHGARVRESDMRVDLDVLNPVRAHFIPLEVEEKQRWIPRKFATGGERLRQDTRVVCVVGDIERDAIALVHRRIVESRQTGARYLPLVPVEGTEASLMDLMRFIGGELDAAKILDLARPLMALRWDDPAFDFAAFRERIDSSSDADEREAAGSLALFGLFRLCHHWGPVPLPSDTSNVAFRSAKGRPFAERKATIPDGIPVRLDPAIFARLMVGGVQQAAELASQRLSASGLRPKLRTAIGTEFDGRRLAAALAFPISFTSALRLAARLTRPTLSREEMNDVTATAT